MDANETNADLESFREQWLSDLRARDASLPASAHHATSPSNAARAKSPVSRRYQPSLAANNLPLEDDDGSDFVPSHSFDNVSRVSGRTLDDSGGPDEEKSLVSALDHYEEAMEKEAQGNMGDSLHLYRRAYRMDQGVDRRYREKYFPAGHQVKPKALLETTPSATGPLPLVEPSISTAQPPADVPSQDQPIEELIASFSSFHIEPLAPEVEGSEPPPCPIAFLPDELLVHILHEVAVHDVADFARISRVCKRFAYLVSHEQRIWNRVCVGDRFGFTGMHYHWQTSIEWEPLDGELIEADPAAAGIDSHFSSPIFVSRQEIQRRQRADKVHLAMSLVPSSYPTWRAMFRSRPRIRFNGCYISTVNYVRTGVMSTNQATWGGAPIHIVTYYRYLRLFRDGTCISLLTTSEPADVVHNLTRDLLYLHRDSSSSSYLPSAMMRHALQGRWRLSSTLDNDDDDEIGQSSGVGPEDTERDLYIETEGVGPKYMYRMDLSLRSAGKGARNNKLVWRGFYSYNKLTDDWGEFQLKNDKPFFFSRVKSYGFGE